MCSARGLMQADDWLQPVAIASDALSLYLFENVAIIAWHKASSAADIAVLYELVCKQKAQYPAGMSFIHIGQVRHESVKDEPRAEFIRCLRDLNSYIVATAIVTHASGFLASALRSVVTGLLVLARISHDLRFHESVEEIFEWLPAKHEQATGVKLDIEQLRAVMAKAQSSLARSAL
jgi:hypothetical protein